MRTFLIAVLLAGVATPALAARPDNDDRGERHHERWAPSETKSSPPRQERSAERPQQRTAEPRVESVRHSGGANSQNSTAHPRNDRGNAPAVEQAHSRDAGNAAREGRRQDRTVETSATVASHNFEPKEVRAPRDRSEVASSQQHSGGSVRNGRSRERSGEGGGSTIEERNVRRAPAHATGDLVQSRHPVPRVFERGERRVSRTPIRGTEPPAPRTASSRQAHAARHWNSDWRHDNRYDWRKWRRHHRSNFHFGVYYDPFGWDYLQYGIGWRLWPSYYRSNYWLNDPWQYRLPPAYGPYRWVRYFNDALLVNIYTGEVVDVEYNFFW